MKTTRQARRSTGRLWCRFLAVLLAVFCLSINVFAYEYPYMAGDYDQLSRVVEEAVGAEVFLDGHFVAGGMGLNVRPGSVVDVYLPASLLGNISSTTPMDENYLRYADIQPKYKASLGGAVVDHLSVSAAGTEHLCLSIFFVPELVQTKEAEFSYRVFLTARGSKRPATELTISGKIANPVIAIAAEAGEEAYVDLSDGTVAQATGYVRDVQIYLGNGMSIVSNLFANTRYYGTSSTKLDDTDMLLMAHYPEISAVYSLKTIGLRQGDRHTVSFDLPEEYHVYNAEGQYLGTTNRYLPYSAKYYLATQNLRYLDFAVLN